MNEPLTPLQLEVVNHYAEGEFAHVESMQEAEYVGDTLFVFCLREAADLSGPYDFVAGLGRAIDELHYLRERISLI